MTQRKRIFKLVHEQARRNAVSEVARAPDGFVVTVQEPTRNLDQNALLWVWLTAFSKQLRWPVNGQMTRLSPEEWKDILTAAFRQETQRVALGLDGGMVLLGMRTRTMGVREFA